MSQDSTKRDEDDRQAGQFKMNMSQQYKRYALGYIQYNGEVPDFVAASAEDIVGGIDRVDDDVMEIATPTLAEVYVNQGQINAAITIYERILSRHPDDEPSRQRLEALKSEMNVEKPDKSEEVDGEREKKKKLLTILEAWLANIRLMTDTSLPA